MIEENVIKFQLSSLTYELWDELTAVDVSKLFGIYEISDLMDALDIYIDGSNTADNNDEDSPENNQEYRIYCEDGVKICRAILDRCASDHHFIVIDKRNIDGKYFGEWWRGIYLTSWESQYEAEDYLDFLKFQIGIMAISNHFK